MDRRARRALGGRLQAGHRRLATCTDGNHSPARAQTQRPGGLIQIAQPLALVGSRGCRPAVSR
jgi:hypothetical protein